MNMSLHLPDDLMNELKLHASNAGVELDAAAADLLRKGLATSNSGFAEGTRPVIIKTHSLTGLPYIECPADAPARQMTVEELLSLEHEIQAQQGFE